MKEGLRILHLEDDDGDADLIKAHLSDGGIISTVMRVLKEADFVKQICDFSPNLILADYHLPSFDGMSALAIARKECPGVPFIFVSGALGEEVATESLKNGATDYVLKRNLPKLVPAVNRALREIEERKEREKAEQALRDSELRYKRLIEAVTSYIYTMQIKDRQPSATNHGPGCLSVTGYTQDEYNAAPDLWYRMIHIEDREAVRRHTDRLLEGEAAVPIEHRIIHKTGAVRWVRNTPVPRFDRNGQLVAYDGLIVDITERKQIEEAIWRAKKEWENTFDAIAEIIFIHDKDFRIVRANKAYKNMAGIPYPDLIGKPYYHVFPRMDGPHDLCEDLAGSGRTDKKELTIESRGKIFNVSRYVKTDVNGRYLYSVQIMQDITERKRAEAALKSSEEIFRQLAENIREVFWMASPNLDKIIYISPAYESVWGRSRESLYEDPKSFLDAIHPDDRKFAFELYTDVYAKGIGESGFSLEYRIVRPDGVISWIHDRGFQVKDSTGQVYRFAGVAEDITGRKMMMEAEIAKETAEATSRAKSDFIACLSHELRTPLNAVIGFSDVLATGICGPMTERQNEYVSNISSSGRHLLSLINNILDLSKAEAGKMELELDENSVSILVESSLVLIREEAIRNKLNVTCSIEDGLDCIIADGMKIKQTLCNLLSNAVKFTPENGSIHVAAAFGEDRNSAIFSVKDSGIGMSYEDQRILFQPFLQLNTGLSRKYRGTGLGLSLCKKMIELHGGQIWVESAAGKGSCFSFSLPLRTAESDY